MMETKIRRKTVRTELLMGEVERLIGEGMRVTIGVKGNSMRPFLADGRDSITLRPFDPAELRPGMVVLARESETGRYLIHRIVRRRGDRLLLQGDGNAVQQERAEVGGVVAVACAFGRKGRDYAADGRAWRLYSACWTRIAALRRFLVRLRRSLGYVCGSLSGYGSSLAMVVLTGMVSVALSLGFIYLSKRAIDVATAGSGASLAPYAAALVGMSVLMLLFGAAESWVSVRMRVGVGNALRHRLFERLLHSRWNGLEQFHTGDVVNRVERDTSSVVGLLTVSCPAFIVMSVQLLAAFWFFCYLDARLPWVVLGMLPFFFLGSRFYMKRMYRFTHKIRKSDSRIQSIIQESLQHRTVIQALEQAEGSVDKLDAQQGTLRMRLMKRTRFSILSRTCISAAFAGGYLAAFLWGIVGLSAGTVTFGTMAAFLQLVGRVQRPVLDLARLVPSLVETLTAVDRLRELEEVPAETAEGQARLAATPDVVLSDVTFRYRPGDRAVLDRFSCHIPAGACAAVVGETGRGKTTLVRLLLGLVRPQEGKACLRLDGEEAELSPATRCNFTYVPQGNTLFSGTVRDNLRMGNPDATDDEMLRALRLAAADFVETLPGGLSAWLGEQGAGLSEGQAQRIAIARALLRDGHIVLLDEATSALDAATERQILDNLRREVTGKTFIFVTHHAAVAQQCAPVVRL